MICTTQVYEGLHSWEMVVMREHMHAAPYQGRLKGKCLNVHLRFSCCTIAEQGI